jgi:hypothetical protein
MSVVTPPKVTPAFSPGTRVEEIECRLLAEMKSGFPESGRVAARSRLKPASVWLLATPSPATA